MHEDIKATHWVFDNVYFKDATWDRADWDEFKCMKEAVTVWLLGIR